jgi:hypothetical protein
MWRIHGRSKNDVSSGTEAADLLKCVLFFYEYFAPLTAPDCQQKKSIELLNCIVSFSF